MTLFPDDPNLGERYKRHTESMYSYLTGSNRPVVGRIRIQLDDWFSRYPAEHAGELVGDFASEDDRQHIAAAFELTLHELLLCRACGVEIHPSLEGVTTRPDFLVTPPRGTPFYLEARTTSDMSDAAYRAARFEGEFIDALNKIHCPDFSLFVTMHNHPNTQPPFRKAAKDLEGKIAELDYEEFMEKWFDYQGERHPRFERDYNGWRVDISPMPRPRRLRGTPNPSPVLASGMGIAGLVTAKDSVKKALYKKSKRYGKLATPYVIAINYTGWASIHVNEMVEVLYGNTHLALVEQPDGRLEGVPGRTFDGFWTKARRPRNRNVSGVLLFDRAVPRRLATTTAMYYVNPWATEVMGSNVFGVSVCSTDDGGDLKFVEAPAPREILGLPEGWPDSD